MKNFKIRRFNNSDADSVSNMLRRNFLEVNIKDYPKDEMEQLSDIYNSSKLIEINTYAHFYVACVDNQIVGCGAISSYNGKPDESIFLTIFVSPEFHGKCIGKSIIDTLEKDEFFLRAKRIEIPSSITACEFYKKLGYSYKDGLAELDSNGLYLLEKFR